MFLQSNAMFIDGQTYYVDSELNVLNNEEEKKDDIEETSLDVVIEENNDFEEVPLDNRSELERERKKALERRCNCLQKLLILFGMGLFLPFVII